MEILPSDVSQSGPSESVMHVEVDRQTAPEKLAELEAGISRILGDVHRAVEDYPRMKEHMNRAVAEIRTPYPEGLIPEVVDEDKAFLKWLADQHCQRIPTGRRLPKQRLKKNSPACKGSLAAWF